MAIKQTDFSLEAPAGCDIWKKPPSTNVWTAPSTHDQNAPIPLNTLQSTRVTFRSKWTEKFDQAGVLLLLSEGPSQSWIKAGLEYYNGQPCISFVGCDRFADWSVHPVHGDSQGNVTVELRREGYALWAYELVLDAAGKETARHPFRECTWLWENEDRKTVQIGAYCARPAKEAGLGPLAVHFSELSVAVKDT